MISLVKNIHVICVMLSFAGFFVRGIWMLTDSPRLKQRWVKTLPHMVDTLLLASAIYLAVLMHFSPLQQPWLMAKIIALLVYIGAGMIALRFGRSRRIRCLAWLFGIVTIIYIMSVATSKSVLGPLVYFQTV